MHPDWSKIWKARAKHLSGVLVVGRSFVCASIRFVIAKCTLAMLEVKKERSAKLCNHVGRFHRSPYAGTFMGARYGAISYCVLVLCVDHGRRFWIPSALIVILVVIPGFVTSLLTPFCKSWSFFLFLLCCRLFTGFLTSLIPARSITLYIDQLIAEGFVHLIALCLVGDHTRTSTLRSASLPVFVHHTIGTLHIPRTFCLCRRYWRLRCAICCGLCLCRRTRFSIGPFFFVFDWLLNRSHAVNCYSSQRAVFKSYDCVWLSFYYLLQFVHTSH